MVHALAISHFAFHFFSQVEIFHFDDYLSGIQMNCIMFSFSCHGKVYQALLNTITCGRQRINMFNRKE